jgi:hypothetical protein
MSNQALVLVAAGFLSYAISPSGRSTALADEGTAVVQSKEPGVWTRPCSVGAGASFTARTDRMLGTDSSQPGDPFTARVVTALVSSCGSDFIPSAAIVRGRVARVEQGASPALVLELTDADTAMGPTPISGIVRTGAGLEWFETNAGSSYRSFELRQSESMPWPSPTSEPRHVRLTLPASSLIEVELVEPVLILP